MGISELYSSLTIASLYHYRFLMSEGEFETFMVCLLSLASLLVSRFMHFTSQFATLLVVLPLRFAFACHLFSSYLDIGLYLCDFHVLILELTLMNPLSI